MAVHRNDIDGMRAVAVGAVVLYHCGFSAYVPGGFVGVDIFFVISGYLITSILLSDNRSPSTTIIDFYNRRIRRIFPAIILMYIFVLAASFFLLMPAETKIVSRNIISSVLFSSNIVFYRTAGYFDPESDYNAVLHTWSLSVEEQFYIVFPVIVLLLRRFGRNFHLYIFIAMAIISLILAQWAMSYDTSAAFFLVHNRAWELLIGSILATGAVGNFRSQFLNEAMGLLGVVLVVGSVILTSDRSFPGLAAVPVCLGTALLIYSAQEKSTIVSKTLGLAPFRFIGLVSYSFYLWHWPVWVFASQMRAPEGPLEKLSLICICFLIAVASWYFVEGPFRRNSFQTKPSTVMAYGGLAMAATCIGAALIPLTSELFWRIPERVKSIAQFVNYEERKFFRSGHCFLDSGFNDYGLFDKAACLHLSNKLPNYVLIGDSHAAHLYPGLSANPHVNILQATASGCKPLASPTGEQRCTELMNFMFDDFLPKHHTDTIIISARWRAHDLPRLSKLIEKLKSFTGRVVVMGPIAEYEAALPRILAMQEYRGVGEDTTGYLSSEPGQIDRLMKQNISKTGAVYVSTYDAVCPGGKCTVWSSKDSPLQFDYGHLTAEGSRLVVGRMSEAVFGAHAQ